MKGKLVLVRSVQGINWDGLHLSGTMSRERRACPCPSDMRNQVSGTLSVRYKFAQREGSFSSIRDDESSRWDFVCPLRSRVKGEHVLVRLVRGIKQVGLHPSGLNSCKKSLSTFVRYEKSSKRDFVHLVRSHVIRGHVLVCLVRRIKHAGLHPFGTNSRKRRACPRPSGTRNHASWTSSV